ncbi:hypothetical protein [Actinomadura sp. NBRC 104425]|uniref:hypothetical protein n=1 Tax=Actinomadura sp. NBRC 104425 TaxID=3032204 RepID=UPI002552F5A8|nr:hypothetical protein [Actinomadura sp. NBRC 104425]
MNGITAAFGATALYYVSFAVFRLAAARVEPLRGNRIPRMAWVVLTDWVFLAGLVPALGGLVLQIIAMGELALGVAIPIFMSGLLPLLAIALVFFGERLTAREWLSLLLVGGAVALLVLSMREAPPIGEADVPPWRLAAVVVPPLLVPVVILVLEDVRPDGRHARPVTGIAYGLASGFPVGTAELAIKGWSDAGGADPQVLATPYPYVTVVAAAIGFGIMVAAFQRCRVSIVATVMTVAAKTYLLLMGTLLYGEPWPRDTGHSAMRLAALALAAIAVAQFPRHHPAAEPAAAHEEPQPPARDPFGQIPPSRDPLSRDPFGQAHLAAPYLEQPPKEAPPARGPSADEPPGQAPDRPSPSEEEHSG